MHITEYMTEYMMGI